MRWAWRVAYMGGREGPIQGFGEKPEGRERLEDLREDGRVILKWIFK